MPDASLAPYIKRIQSIPISLFEGPSLIESQSSMGNAHMEYILSFVRTLSLLWLQIQPSLFIMLAASPMHRIYSSPEWLYSIDDCILPKYVNSSTGPMLLPSTIITSAEEVMFLPDFVCLFVCVLAR